MSAGTGPASASVSTAGDGAADVRAHAGDELGDEPAEHGEGDRQPGRHTDRDHHRQEPEAVDYGQQQARVQIAADLLDRLVHGPAQTLLLRGLEHERSARCRRGKSAVR